MNFRIFCLGLIIILSCSRDKNKPYEKVEIIRDETEKKPKVKPELKIPSIYGKNSMLLIELSQSDLEINSWAKDSIYIDKTFPGLGNEMSEIYQENDQLIIREKSIDVNSKGNTWKLIVPKFTDLTIRSKNGSVTIQNINGTFNIASPVGDVKLDNCSAALQVNSQTGNISLKNWEQMGRSKLTTASGKIEIDSKANLSYQITAHSGSDTIKVDLNGNALKMNLRLLTFKGEGKVDSEYSTSDIEEFFSDALDRYYDLRKIQLNKAFPTSTLSTGNGTITIIK